MIRIPGRIPIFIHPAFWVVAAIIGFFNSLTFTGTLIWIFVILVSVLIHELGHAITAVVFGLNPRIELVALGGLTYHRGDKLPFLKQFFIVLDGPLFGFFLFLVAFFLLKVPSLAAGTSGTIIYYFYWVNLVWTILNLVPVMPLDGGQLLRIVLEGAFGLKGFKYSLIIGTLIAGLLSLAFFLFQYFLIGALFFLFAFQSYDIWRSTRNISDKDRSEDLKGEFEKAEADLQAGRKEQAAQEFERIRLEAKKGMLYNLATQYLAFLKYDQGDLEGTYGLLHSIRAELSPEALCLFHRVAYEKKDYSTVTELAGSCFQTMPSAEVALRNAHAHAALSQSRAAVGWLETAFQEGLNHLSKIMQDKIFDPIREDPHFQAFAKHHQG
ncbi:MAG TPA: site-2 protease family protein [Rhabdochlamydiaceae bacterium]|nr:site-2 protease family protein [Rhabdochlamydiaceae bacterium]